MDSYGLLLFSLFLLYTYINNTRDKFWKLLHMASNLLPVHHNIILVISYCIDIVKKTSVYVLGSMLLVIYQYLRNEFEFVQSTAFDGWNAIKQVAACPPAFFNEQKAVSRVARGGSARAASLGCACR